MTPAVVSEAEPGSVAQAAAALQAGGLVVLPTDTIYGVAALPSPPGATRLFAAKGRPADVAVAVLVADLAQARALAADIPAWAERLLARAWPGPLTVVLARATAGGADHAGGAGLDLGGDASTVGVRCPDHPWVRNLAARVGPVAVTSANRHGQPTPPTATEAAASLVVPPDLVVDGGARPGTASTVVDATGPEPRILRQGALSEDDVVDLIGRAEPP